MRELIGYASRTGTARNLAALKSRGWRLLISAAGAHRSESMRYAIDNGAWSAYMSKQDFDESAFRSLVRTHGEGADWIVVPDIVQGGQRSLLYSQSWLAEISGVAPMLIAVQDGMTPSAVGPILAAAEAGIFVGGSTQWKLSSLPAWGDLARGMGCYLHVGRVNSQRRIAACAAAGADSFDGSGVSKYSVTLPALDAARKQLSWRM